MKILKIIKRYIVFIIALVLVLVGIIYYAYCYIPTQTLLLTDSDKYLLLLIILCIFIFICCTLYFAFKLDKIENAITKLYNTVCDIEDNNSKSHMTTQNMIMTLYKKFGEIGHEKE